MICLICRQAEIIGGLTSVEFNRGEVHLVITNLPAQVCPSCGEAYVSEEVAAQLLRIAKEMSEAGEFEAEREYSNT